jgi:hypothetical protein
MSFCDWLVNQSKDLTIGGTFRPKPDSRRGQACCPILISSCYGGFPVWRQQGVDQEQFLLTAGASDDSQITRRIQAPCSARIALVRLLALAILALVLCSCADSYEILGLHLKRAADGDKDNAGHGSISGEGDPGGT